MRSTKGQFVKGNNGWIGRKHSKKTKELLSIIHSSGHCLCHKNHKGFWAGKKRPTGESSTNWRGDKVKYGGLHDWVKKVLGQPTTCENCYKSKLIGRKIHWANISKKYKRDINDWERLCVACHFKKDNVIQKAWKTRKG